MMGVSTTLTKKDNMENLIESGASIYITGSGAANGTIPAMDTVMRILDVEVQATKNPLSIRPQNSKTLW